MIDGIYHSLSTKYLQRYIDEAVWRYNTRGIKGGERFSHMFRSSIGAVDYGMVKQVV